MCPPLTPETEGSPGRRLALVLEYDGTRYHGIQWQSNASSIQGEVEAAIGRLTGEQVRIGVAGRTDAGVHAMGQVVAFTTGAPYQEDTFRDGLNHYLPPDIVVKVARQVPGNFDPRRHASSRVYRYTLLNRRAPSALWRNLAHHEPRPLDVPAMERALRSLEGRHDFGPFSGPLERQRTTVRRLLRTELRREEDLVILEVEGDAFLPQQVRRMGGALLQVGAERMPFRAFRRLARSGLMGAAQQVLPAKGLCLLRVEYPECFKIDPILKCGAGMLLAYGH